ncbi:SIR2 family protein [Mucilaginibacter daejeonensis]|uniref:SIR2 family protein n=1 Tax=Mucilaginibacter daejeonensis TaxID=398049 RepID=UPI001D1728FF|nr:SIR2 family protein [Mucilaginibacter daejeonensis]UEG53339.1 SIR2 family protein [Mucilaginibacter daejeonensis]
MKILTTPEEVEYYVENNLATYYKKRSLFPFFGAGFTMGAKTMRGVIPDGSTCVQMMKNLIVTHNQDLHDDLIHISDFDKVAGLFYRVVPKDVIADFIYDNFTGAKLDKVREEFINLSWPFIYTLNIDDAIERNSKYRAILPNVPLTKKYLSEVIFKLHGDAIDEISYIKHTEGIIFSRQQYLRSIINNKDLLDIFLEDYTSVNFILIGCSLDNELDLEFILANNDIKSKKETDKIYLTSRVPSPINKLKLESYGINICLVVDDYSGFYSLVNEKFKDVDISTNEPFKRYQVDKLLKNSNKQFNMRALLGEQEIRIENNTITVPQFFIDRAVLPRIANLLLNEDIIFIIGKRVSGKTFLLYSIANIVKNKSVYLFPSKVSFDSDYIDKLLELQNVIVMFDTDTLAAFDIEDIYYRISDFVARNISFVFCINSSDRLMIAVPYTRVFNRELIEVDAFLSYEEVGLINKNLSRFGIANFRSSVNILNNIIHHKEIYRNLNADLNSISSALDSKLLTIYILCATFDKVYSSLFRALQIDQDKLSYAVNLSKSAIEFEYDIELIEQGQHSSFKVITNSKVFLFSLLGHYISNQKNVNIAVSTIVDVVKRLKTYDRFKTYYKSIIAFDSLNQIFYKRSGGAANLIFLIYGKLEELLYIDTHYWMQRAKSIYYLKRTNVQELLTAAEYAKKPYFDSADHSRIKINASFQIALIYIRIVITQKFNNHQTFTETVKWVCIALKENLHNSKVIENLIEDAKKGKMNNDYYQFATFVLDNPSMLSPNDRETILSKLFSSKIISKQ